MINKIFMLLLPLALVAGCTNEPARPAIQVLPELKTYTGMIRYDRGFSNFIDCESKRLYLLADSTKTIGALHFRACQPAQCPEEKVFAVLKARLFSGSGKAENDPGTLGVVEVLELTPAAPLTTCIPYEFWCSDDANTWSLSISKEFNAAFFKDLKANKGYTFRWAPPAVSDNSISYKLNSLVQPSESMEVTIQQANCGAKPHSYRAEVRHKGKKYIGCAQKWQRNG